MMELYRTGRYGRLNPDWHEADAPHKAKAVAGLIRSLGLRPARVVDVGCGTGEVLRLVKAAFDEAGLLTETRWEGWDVAPDAIARSAERAGPRLRYVHGDWPVEGERADVVLCIDTFEHTGDDVAFLEALAGRADWLVLRIPLDLSALDVLRPGRMLAARRDWGHRHAYTRELAFEVLGEAGLEVVAWRYDRVPPSVDGARGRVVDAARRALFAVAEDATVRALGGWSLLVAARPAGQSRSGQRQR